MKNINKNATESFLSQYKTTLKTNKGCLYRQPFSFTNISIVITYSKILLQNQITHPTNKTACFTSQTEILKIAPIKPVNPPLKTRSYQLFENGGII